MEPSITTIRIGPRIELYGPMPISIFEALTKCLETDYPHAMCTGGDPYTQLLMTITLGQRRGNSTRMEISPCPPSPTPSGKASPNTKPGCVETAQTADGSAKVSPA